VFTGLIVQRSEVDKLYDTANNCGVNARKFVFSCNLNRGISRRQTSGNLDGRLWEETIMAFESVRRPELKVRLTIETF